MNADNLQTVWAPRVLSILRIVAALIFMEHGTQKLLGFPPGIAQPELFSLIGLAGCSSCSAASPGARAVHPPGGVHPVRRDGGRLLDAHAPQSFFPVSTAAILRSSTASCSSTWPAGGGA